MTKKLSFLKMLKGKGGKRFSPIRILGAFLLLCFVLSIVLFLYYVKDFPRPEKFTERRIPQSTKIYDRTGEVLLYEIYGEEKRTWVPLGEIPDKMKEAVIAAEDANFYNHFGVDFKGVLRAVFADLKIGLPVYGGSTIPQQLIRSAFLTTEKTAERKTREIILAIELDRRYSKDQILEWYLNQVPFGQNTYGVEAASQTYFKKRVSELSLPEIAILASLIKSPSHLSPYGDYKDELLGRKDYVLNRMAQEKFITEEEAESAKKEEIKFADISHSIKAPNFTLWVKNYLEEKYGNDFLMEGGLKVYTSLDWELQEQAEAIVKKGVEEDNVYNAYNGALVAIAPDTGEVLSLVGSAYYFGESYPEGCISGKNCLFDPQFNVAIGTQKNPGRQPGSAFKPFIYATAFEKGYTGDTVVVDELTNFGEWGGEDYIPQNYDGLFRGAVTLRRALAQSLNVPAVKVLLNLAGLENSIKTAQDLGINTLTPPYGPSIVLGGWEVKLIEMTSAYGVFANDGLKIPPVFILKIEDSKGNIIEKNEKTPQRVLSSQASRMINDILSDNEARTPMFGARSHLYFENYQVAAKTGTTDSFKDCWALGYTPSISAGVWVGNNNNEPMTRRQPAATVAGPIFHSFMEKALLKYPSKGFLKPGE